MDKSLAVSKVYDKIAKRYTKAFFDDFPDKKELDLFLSKLPTHGKILDIGCGPGNYTKYFIEKEFACKGIDLSSEMIKIAKRKVPQGKFMKMDMRRMPFKQNSFDGLLAAYSILHVPKKDAKKTLLKFNEILKPGGLLLIIIKEGRGERFRIEPFDPREKCYIKLWEKTEIKKLLRANNFRVIFESRKKAEHVEEFKYNILCFLVKNTKQ